MKQDNLNRADQISACAFELFKKKGLSKVSVIDICQASGVTRAVFYSCFSDVEDLVKYRVYKVRCGIDSLLISLIPEKNDFERMWKVCCNDLAPALEFGPELLGEMFELDFKEPFGLMELKDSILDWHSQLCANCQEQGIIRNSSPHKELVGIVSDAVTQVAFEWCRCKGTFDLFKRARSVAEMIYDVAPEYRQSR